MLMHDKNHYNIVISLQLIKINEKNKIKVKWLAQGLRNNTWQDHIEKPGVLLHRETHPAMK